MFALDGDDHRRRRKMLTPAVPRQEHQELRADLRGGDAAGSGDWPDGCGFETLEPMMRITLNVILRAVFGADGDEAGRAAPHHPAMGDARLALGHAARRRREPTADAPVGSARRVSTPVRRHPRPADRRSEGRPDFERRDDVLALLLRSTYEDGSAMSRRDIADETAHAARRGPRNHGVHPGVGLRAGQPAPRGARQAGGRGGDRRQPSTARPPSSRPSAPDGHRLRWHGTFTRRPSNSGSG